MPSPSDPRRLLRRRAGADRRARPGRDVHRHAEHRQGPRGRPRVGARHRLGRPRARRRRGDRAVRAARLVGDGVHDREARRRRLPDRDRHPPPARAARGRRSSPRRRPRPDRRASSSSRARS